MRRITLLVAVAVATSLAAAATLARAATPTQEWIPITDSFTTDECGFAVHVDVVLKLHRTTWTDSSGAPVRQVITAPGARITWTNVATGETVTSANPFAVHRRFNPDGSAVIAFTGLDFAIHGGGRAFVNTGREVIVFASGSIEPVSSSGPGDDLCEALTAAIG